MRGIAAILLLLLLGLPGRSAPAAGDLAGFWQGTIEFPEIKLRMRFHLTREPAGGLSGTLESLDQGARDIPVESVSLDGALIKFSIPAVQGSYEGQVNNAGTYITGQWRHGTNASVSLNLEKRDPSTTEPAPVLSPSELAAAIEAGLKFAGVWDGVLLQDGTTNTIRVKIWRATDGAAKGTLDCAERQMVNLPLRAVRCEEGQVRFEAPGLGASFHGNLSDRAVVGEWRKGGQTAALRLEKVPPPSVPLTARAAAALQGGAVPNLD